MYWFITEIHYNMCPCKVYFLFLWVSFDKNKERVHLRGHVRNRAMQVQSELEINYLICICLLLNYTSTFVPAKCIFCFVGFSGQIYITRGHLRGHMRTRALQVHSKLKINCLLCICLLLKYTYYNICPCKVYFLFGGSH
jgi:TRAP-type uncharacterized transport system fused permease subunit